MSGRSTFLALVSCLLAPGFAQSAELAWRSAFADVVVNGRSLAEPALLRRAGDRIQIDADALAPLRLRLPRGAALIEGGQRWIDLSSIAGAAVEFLEPTQTLRLDLPSGTFPEQVIQGRAGPSPAPSAALSGFALDYDVFGQFFGSRLSGAASLSPRIFTPFGYLEAGAAARSEPSPALVLLDSRAVHNDPLQAITYRAGDGITRPASWAGPARLFGVALSRNFALQPGFVTRPALGLRGDAALPSTVEVFVDGVRRLSQRVNAGPFAIEDLPGVAGAGTASIVIRDELGRERVVEQSFYRADQLLAPGLDDFDLQIGWERTNFAQEFFSLDRPAAAATYRTGITDFLTLDAGAEVVGAGIAAGPGVTLGLGEFGVLSAAAAAGAAKGQAVGYRGVASFSRIGDGVGFALRLALADDDFAALGFSAGTDRILKEFTASLGVSIGAAGSLSLVGSAFERANRDRGGFLTAAWHATVGRALHVAAGTTYSEDSGARLFASLTIPFGRGQADLGVRLVDETVIETVDWRQRWDDRPDRFDLALNLRAGSRDWERGRLAGSHSGREGMQVAEAIVTPSGAGGRLTLTGGAAVLDGDAWLTEGRRGALILVDAGLPEIEVAQEGRSAGSTNAQGRMLLSRARPYEENLVALAADTLPLAAQADRLRIKAVPPEGGAALADFGVRMARPAFVVVRDAAGASQPAGARLVDERGREYIVGTGGRVFLPDLSARLRLRRAATPRSAACEYEIAVPSAEPAGLLLGDVACAPFLGAAR